MALYKQRLMKMGGGSVPSFEHLDALCERIDNLNKPVYSDESRILFKRTKLSFSQEGFFEAIGNILKAIAEAIGKFFSWIFGGKSSGDSKGTTSETVKETTKVLSEAEEQNKKIQKEAGVDGLEEKLAKREELTKHYSEVSEELNDLKEKLREEHASQDKEEKAKIAELTQEKIILEGALERKKITEELKAKVGLSFFLRSQQEGGFKWQQFGGNGSFGKGLEEHNDSVIKIINEFRDSLNEVENGLPDEKVNELNKSLNEYSSRLIKVHNGYLRNAFGYDEMGLSPIAAIDLKRYLTGSKAGQANEDDTVFSVNNQDINSIEQKKPINFEHVLDKIEVKVGTEAFSEFVGNVFEDLDQFVIEQLLVGGKIETQMNNLKKVLDAIIDRVEGYSKDSFENKGFSQNIERFISIMVKVNKNILVILQFIKQNQDLQEKFKETIGNGLTSYAKSLISMNEKLIQNLSQIKKVKDEYYDKWEEVEMSYRKKINKLNSELSMIEKKRNRL